MLLGDREISLKKFVYVCQCSVAVFSQAKFSVSQYLITKGAYKGIICYELLDV